MSKFTVNNREFEFLCHAVRTRNGFAHVCRLYIDGVRFTEAKINYLNRTWERYEFQSVMRRAVDQIIDSSEKLANFQAKEKLGLSRMTKQAKQLAEEMLSSDQLVIDCKELINLRIK